MIGDDDEHVGDKMNLDKKMKQYIMIYWCVGSFCSLRLANLITQSINHNFFKVDNKCYYEVHGSVVDWNSVIVATRQERTDETGVSLDAGRRRQMTECQVEESSRG